MSSILEPLTREVKAGPDVKTRATVLLKGIKTALDRAMASDKPQDLRDLSNSLALSQQANVDAVAGEPEPKPEPKGETE